MENTRLTFINYLNTLVTTTVQAALPVAYPTLNFYVEPFALSTPNEPSYPYVGISDLDNEYSNYGNEREWYCQINVLFNKHLKTQCGQTMQVLIDELKLIDYVAAARGTTKYNYLNDPPTSLNKTINWELSEDAKDMSEERSEIINKMFVLKVTYT